MLNYEVISQMHDQLGKLKYRFKQGSKVNFVNSDALTILQVLVGFK